MNPARRTVHYRSLAVLAAVLALILAACGSSNPLGGGTISGDLKSIVVGSADFPESKIIAEIYAQALEANGFTVGRQFGIGSRETYIPAVKDHSIDLVPEYTGNLLLYFDPDATVTTPDAVELALSRQLPGDLSILTPSPASDTDTVTVTDATAEEVESQDHRGSRAAFGGGEVRCALGVPDPPGRAARTQGEVRPGHRPGELRRDQRRRRPGNGACAC